MSRNLKVRAAVSVVRALCTASATAATVAAAATAAAAADPLLDLVPAGADSVVCVNVRNLADDPTTSRVLASRAFRGDAQLALRQFTAVTGVDLLKDLDRVCYARRMDGGDETGVLLIQGRYDEQRLQTLLDAKGRALETTTVGSLRSVNSWTDDGGTRYHTFLPGGRMVLTFSREAMEGVAGALQTPAREFEERFAGELALLPAGYRDTIAWLHVPAPGKSPFGDEAPATLHIRSFGAVADLEDGDLVVSATARLDDGEYADDLLNMAGGLLAFARLQEGNPMLQTLARRVSLRSETSRTLSASMRIPVEETLALAEQSTRRHGARVPGTPEQQAEAEAARRQAEVARKKAEIARQSAEIARQHAEIARKQAEVARKRAELERELQEQAKDAATTGSAAAQGGQAVPAPPVPPVSPAPPPHLPSPSTPEE